MQLPVLNIRDEVLYSGYWLIALYAGIGLPIFFEIASLIVEACYYSATI
jgi:hypothetical protein